GVKPRDSVLLLSENRLEWLYCDFAIQAAGAVTVPIYAGTPAEMVKAVVANCDPVLAIASNDEAAGKLAGVPTLHMEREIAKWIGRPPVDVSDVVARLEKIAPDDLCTIVYTSGTTGDPKGAELAHRNIVDSTIAALQVFPLTREDSLLSWLPFSHVFERINGFFSCVMFGGQTWISHGVDHLTDDLGEVKPTALLSVPRVYEKMHSAVMQRVREASAVRRLLFRWAMRTGVNHSHTTNPGPVLSAEYRLAERLVLGPLRTRLTGGRLRFFISGGAALAQNIEEFFWAMGVPILNGWGMTETSSGVSSNTLSEHRFLTVGKPFPGTELRIAPDGEILSKGPGNMLGYHKNPTATAETLKDGWVYTGDIGQLDGDGFLKITDRKKDLIKTAQGKYVAPQPLEFELQQCEFVEQAVVIGEGKPYVTALIVPAWPAVNEKIPGPPEELVHDARVVSLIKPRVDSLNKNLGSWESIKYFSLLPRAFNEEEGEITPTLKIKRRVINTRYREKIESMYEHRAKP
ncbi:MAG TPA: AMP-dependent synthetase/ligase, partial [Patescibacteria group bacterium]|nr:AMP-dependent synthetase/ligase [Patescibacteria group bacterium]